VVEPAADGPDQVGGHDPGRLDPEVAVAVAVGDALAGDLEQGPEALGGDEAEPADLALQELVGGHGGAVADGGDRLGADAEGGQDLGHPVQEAVGRVGRGRGVLVATSSPVSSSKATTSVKVPPVSTPTRIRRGAVTLGRRVREARA
jgi:hypothetical protein